MADINIAYTIPDALVLRTKTAVEKILNNGSPMTPAQARDALIEKSRTDAENMVIAAETNVAGVAQREVSKSEIVFT